jgi:hypothetical protein
MLDTPEDAEARALARSMDALPDAQLNAPATI